MHFERHNANVITQIIGPSLSPETERRLIIIFRAEQRADARRMLVEECGNNLPFLEKLDAQGLERYRFAALKLSEGDLTKLRTAVELAKVDWRDLLVAAGFGHDVKEHERWLPKPAHEP